MGPQPPLRDRTYLGHGEWLLELLEVNEGGRDRVERGDDRKISRGPAGLRPRERKACRGDEETMSPSRLFSDADWIEARQFDEKLPREPSPVAVCDRIGRVFADLGATISLGTLAEHSLA